MRLGPLGRSTVKMTRYIHSVSQLPFPYNTADALWDILLTATTPPAGLGWPVKATPNPFFLLDEDVPWGGFRWSMEDQNMKQEARQNALAINNNRRAFQAEVANMGALSPHPERWEAAILRIRDLFEACIQDPEFSEWSSDGPDAEAWLDEMILKGLRGADIIRLQIVWNAMIKQVFGTDQTDALKRGQMRSPWMFSFVPLEVRYLGGGLWGSLRSNIEEGDKEAALRTLQFAQDQSKAPVGAVVFAKHAWQSEVEKMQHYLQGARPSWFEECPKKKRT
jgi:hypothetical protein